MTQLLQEYFMLTQRNSGQYRLINVVDPDKFDAFMNALPHAPIDEDFKVFLCLLAAGGCRVTEILNLRVCDIEKGTQFFKIKVLKKRSEHKPIRDAWITDTIKALVSEYITRHRLRHFDKLFRFKRNHCHTEIVRLFGAHTSCHSFRHSYISFRYHKKLDTIMALADNMKVWAHSIQYYTHINVRRHLVNQF